MMRILSLEPATPKLHINCTYRYLGVEMPLVQISMFEGRDIKTKVKIMKLVTEAICESCSVGPDAVTIIINDVPRTDWGKAGKPYG